MEFIIVFVLLAVLMLCLGFGISDIAVLVLGIIGLGVILTGLFFTVCILFLVTAKRISARFSYLDKESRFPVAVYKVGDEELHNLFPCEMVMRDKLYVPEKDIMIMRCRFKHAVIDKNALITIIAGSAVFIPCAVFVISIALSLLKSTM